MRALLLRVLPPQIALTPHADIMSLNRFVVRQKRTRPAAENKSKTENESAAKFPKLETKTESVSSKTQGGTDTAQPKAERETESKTEKFSPKPKAVSTKETAEGDKADSTITWRKIRAENLDLDYVRLYKKGEADDILRELEEAVTYNTGQLAQVLMFGKWVNIPRKQSAYGEKGLSYTFSGNTVPARPWIPSLTRIRDHISRLTGFDFNFVLVNRYKDGCDYMGEHKDDEKDLANGYPIASLSLGQPRDFYFKHQDSRGKNATRKINVVKLELEHGGLLLMNPPTNQFWYHALPQRKRLGSVRINLTFRKMNPAMCKPAKNTV